MPRSDRTDRFKLFLSILATLLSMSFAVHALAQDSGSSTTIKTYQDKNGWKLLVNGESYYVKGMVWGYTPAGENYSYDLWSKSDEYIKNVLDYDCKLMKAAGVNTIRSFFNTPPKWVEYIYTKYGIMTIVNHLAGRYGYQIDGVWHPHTDYSDRRTREVLKSDFLEMVRKFKNTPGVLMFALGNESNYGLEWSSSEIENLPVGERHKEKAKFLYSLYNEIIAESKKIDSNHPYTIVNGDIQYIDLIAEYCKELDILGSNAYRGRSFTSLWKDVKEKLDKPVLFMEFGSDAFNAKTDEEDQTAQADILKAQWQEIYGKSYGNGGEGNAIGGCVFEWRDEWWKYLQTENLYIHDRNASWSNGGYPFDYVEGENNMNEEWYGIVQLGRPNKDGVSEAYPRMAYYVLQELWKIDPYRQDKKEINSGIEKIDMQRLALESDVRLMKQTKKREESFYLSGGSLKAEFVSGGKDNAIHEKGKDGLTFSSGEMIFLDFGFRPSSMLTGDFSVNLINDIPNKEMEIFYGRSREKKSAEIYSYNSTLKLDSSDVTAFYHTPRYHWGYEGDFYGLLREATDIKGMDIWDAKAPFGAEITGKKGLEGLKIVFGPEIYWGANPKIMAKYNFGTDHFKCSIIHSEDLARASTSSTGTSATEKATRATTFYVKSDILSNTTIELGAISAGSEKVGDEYNYLDKGNIVYDKIRFDDSLGAKAKVTYKAPEFGLIYAAASYAGLVADGGNPLREFDTLLPYSQYGNKVEVEGGLGLFMGNYTLFPRILWRDSLRSANPSIQASSSGTSLYPGLSPRNRESDPFAVLDNRKALSGEIIFTYDPTPATDFYHWDSKNREDAPFAFNLGFNFTDFSSPTDSYQFFYKEGNTNAAFGTGLAEEKVWKGVSRMVLNPNPWLRIANRLEVGFQQSTGAAGPTRTYYSTEFDLGFGKKHTLSGYIKKDQWGPYDYYRQFNVTYPWQFSLDYMYKIDHVLQKFVVERLGKSAGIGIMGIYRTLDKNSPVDESDGGKNNYAFQVTTYLTYEF